MNAVRKIRPTESEDRPRQQPERLANAPHKMDPEVLAKRNREAIERNKAYARETFGLDKRGQ